ncbi:hypothetical protein BOSEA31B_12252 [Hyphomicrobiales bacterium]|nr:hypothetical protein BOSEA31B_12252 [Hyphomicrobiales bacterium]CAH1698031.1 hypothetical protein BOSEA1005_11076 [Hyphomicrobiales bacterium]CAI0347674.1 hypothetical protein BO1005MUT1_90035 [Hyphomicrobiales bacterium]
MAAISPSVKSRSPSRHQSRRPASNRAKKPPPINMRPLRLEEPASVCIVGSACDMGTPYRRITPSESGRRDAGVSRSSDATLNVASHEALVIPDAAKRRSGIHS